MNLRPTSERWLAAAVADLPTLLIDHAHCERKAAQTALKMMARYADRPSIVTEMSRLAREELVHFERVIGHLEKRGLAFRPLQAAGYASALLELVDAKHRLRDEMLVCAIIEARSCERFVRLAGAARAVDAELADFYEELVKAEARHEELYLELAAEQAPDSWQARLAELLAAEANVLERPGQPLRMHSG